MDIEDAVIIEETKKPEPKLTESQMALASYEHFTNAFVSKVKDFPGSKGSLQRAWANSSVSPLNKGDLHFSYPEEKELFDLFTEANSAKLILMVYALQDAGVLTVHKPLQNITNID